MSDAERITLLESIKTGIQDDYSFILYVRSKLLKASKRQYNLQKSKEVEQSITSFNN